MILPFVGFISLTPPVGTPLQLKRWRGALQTGIWTGNIYFFPGKKGDVRRFCYFLTKPKSALLNSWLVTCYLQLVTSPYMLEFFQATIRFNHQGVALR